MAKARPAYFLAFCRLSVWLSLFCLSLCLFVTPPPSASHSSRSIRPGVGGPPPPPPPPRLFLSLCVSTAAYFAPIIWCPSLEIKISSGRPPVWTDWERSPGHASPLVDLRCPCPHLLHTHGWSQGSVVTASASAGLALDRSDAHFAGSVRYFDTVIRSVTMRLAHAWLAVG